MKRSLNGLETFTGLAIFTCIATLLAIITVLANTAVIYAFYKSFRLRKNLSNYFVINLAASDILVSVCPVPMWLFNLWHLHTLMASETYTGIMPQKYVTLYVEAFQFIDAMLINVAVCNLAFLSIERYLAIAMPIWHRANTSQNRVVTACLVAWIFAIACAGAATAFNNSDSGKLIYKAVAITIPFVVIITVYVMLVWNILLTKRGNSSTVLSASSCNMENRTVNTFKLGNETKLTFRLSLITLVFLICWLPYISWTIWCSSRSPPVNIFNTSYFYTATVSLKYLTYFNSLLNPFLYVFGRPAFSAVLKDLLCRRKKKRSITTHRNNNGGPLAVIGSNLSLTTIQESHF